MFSQLPGLGGKLKKLQNTALNLGKDAANKKLNSKLHQSADDKLTDAHESFDPSAFKFAISFSDNAGLFEVHENFKTHKKIINNVFQDHNVDFFSVKNTKSELNQSSKDLKDDTKEEITKKPQAQKPEFHNKTGEFFYASNKFKLAEREFIWAQKLSGDPSSPIYLLAKSNLGLVYHTTGRYTEAQKITKEVLEKRKEIDEKSAEYAVSLNNLGVLHKDLGEYHKAEKLLLQSLEINQKVVGKKSLAYALNLNNMAMLYHEIGQFQKAEEHSTKAIEVAKSNIGEKSANFIKLKINLAIIYRDNQKYEDAEKIYLEAIKIKEKRHGNKHPDYAHLKKGLAALYLEMGKNDQVAPLLNEALAIYTKVLGKEHPSTATIYFELGILNRITGDLTKSDQHLQQSLDVRGKILGIEHPEYINTLEEVALLEWQKNNEPEAKKHFKKVIDYTLRFVRKNFAAMSEREKTKYWDKLQPRLFKYYSFVADNSSSDKSLVNDMYEIHLQTKGLLLHASTRIKQLILSSKDEKLKLKYIEWLDTKEELARLYNYSKKELEDEQIDISSLEKKSNDLEKELSSLSSSFEAGYNQNHITTKEISKEITSQEAIVDIVEYHYFKTTFTEEQHYSYFITQQNSSSPTYVLNREGKRLDTKNTRYYRNCIKLSLTDKKSYKNFWSMINPHVSKFKHLYVSLDGSYNQININTLKDESGVYNITKHAIVLVNNVKDIIDIKKNASQNQRKKTAVLYGHPNYGESMHIKDLPGTKVEIESIQKTLKNAKFKVDTYTGNDFNETNFKTSEKASIVHIACHGFFLEQTKNSKNKVMGIETSQASDNPLLKSGLMLSGAQNIYDTNYVDHSSADNGIVTAYEIMNTDLSKTDIVILSACETGLGDIKVGEGVYGLQRAFQMAGSASIIMSLWKVNDQTTQLLMTEMYRHIVLGKSNEVAFQLAQKALKAKFENPQFWGAFVMVRSR